MNEYCVKNNGTCKDNNYACGRNCPQPQISFDFMKDFDFMNKDIDSLKDDVNRPDHYTIGSIEVFDFISSWDLSFAEGNVVKYVVRAPYKGTTLKDLKKAQWYLNQLIKKAEQDAHG